MNTFEPPSCNIVVLYLLKLRINETVCLLRACMTGGLLFAIYLCIFVRLVDEKSSQVIGIVDTELNFHIFPDTPVTRSKLSAKLSSLYIYLANTTNNLFRGYQIAMVKQGKMELFPVWSVAVPSDQKMVQVSDKRSDEVVNSVGRVLGDHTVLYKYLNPNLVGLMAVQGEGAKGSLFVYIIDAVTGNSQPGSNYYFILFFTLFLPALRNFFNSSKTTHETLKLSDHYLNNWELNLNSMLLLSCGELRETFVAIVKLQNYCRNFVRTPTFNLIKFRTF